MLKHLLPIFISATLLFVACSEDQLSDSDFRISFNDNPEGALRSFFFSNMQDSISFNEFGRPVADNDTSRKYGIRLISALSSEGNLDVSYKQATVISFDRDSLTPVNAQLSSLHLSLPGSQAFWKFGPKKGQKEVKQINLIVPNTIKPGTFKIQVGATFSKSTIDTSGKIKVIRTIVPDKTISVKLN